MSSTSSRASARSSRERRARSCIWGSGISLFIAGSVAQQIFTGTFNWEPSQAGGAIPAGTIPKTVYYLQHYSGSQLASGGIEQIMVAPPNPLIALIGTVAIFLIVAYVE